MPMAGLISHLRWTEHCWFEVLFLNHLAEENLQFAEEDGMDWLVDDVPLAQLLEDYEKQVARSNEIVAAHSLDDTGRNPDFGSGGATLRWMVIHMVEETARHAGHADAMRELLDGTTGYY
jgi:hypothetical protein